MTQQEKTSLLAFSLVNKYDLYIPQNNATLAACVGEYLDATQKTAEEEIAVEPAAEERIVESDFTEDVNEQTSTVNEE